MPGLLQTRTVPVLRTVSTVQYRIDRGFLRLLRSRDSSSSGTHARADHTSAPRLRFAIRTRPGQETAGDFDWVGGATDKVGKRGGASPIAQGLRE